jgi:chromosome partitioning protein
MRRIIALANQKGGVGKTTVAVNLASCLAELDQSVLLIDLDQQYSATTWFEVTDGGRGVFDLFADAENTTLESLIFPTSVAGLSIVPSSQWMAGLELALKGEVGAEQVLKLKLAELAPDRFDYVLIDCPPSLGIITVNALNAALEVLIPVEMEAMSLHGLALLLGTIEKTRKRLNPHLAIAGILGTNYEAHLNRCKDIAALLDQRFPDQQYRTRIRKNTKLAECPSHGVPITVYDPKGNGTADFRALAREVLDQEQEQAIVEAEGGLAYVANQ